MEGRELWRPNTSHWRVCESALFMRMLQDLVRIWGHTFIYNCVARASDIGRITNHGNMVLCRQAENGKECMRKYDKCVDRPRVYWTKRLRLQRWIHAYYRARAWEVSVWNWEERRETSPFLRITHCQDITEFSTKSQEHTFWTFQWWLSDNVDTPPKWLKNRVRQLHIGLWGMNAYGTYIKRWAQY